ncbi:unnamed protein product [Prorocentrum cordatum]|uniref:Peptidase A1 domain-containing protein n=1 Tax=Prorocentrum cordatum TaxID=2364126 RepID=A0ABN9T376_9DINO|nr:unnamed protein product [Polarella glacialis]
MRAPCVRAAGRWAVAWALSASCAPPALASRLAGRARHASLHHTFQLSSGASVTPLLHGGAAEAAAPPEAELPPGVPVSSRQVASLLRVRRGRGHSFRSSQRSSAAVPCTDLYGTEYAGPISVGTTVGADGKPAPQADLRVIYDTGSADFWVASDLCERFPCTLGDHRRFNHTKSTTFQASTSLIQVSSTYGSGTLRGLLGEDDVRIGPLTVKGQKIGLVSEEVGSAFEMSFDGIVGLGFPSLSNATATPLFDNLVAQGKLAAPEFAFYLHRRPDRGGAVLWGSTDSRLYEGSVPLARWRTGSRWSRRAIGH